MSSPPHVGPSAPSRQSSEESLGDHHVLMLNALSLLHFEDAEDHPREHVFGMMDVGGQRAAVIALPYYLQLVESRKYLMKLEVEHKANHATVSRLGRQIDDLLEANRQLQHENQSIITANNDLRTKSNAHEQQIQSLLFEVQLLKQSISAAKSFNDVLSAKNTAIAEQIRLQELKFASAELVYEIQRLLVVYIGSVKPGKSRAADVFVEPMFRAIYAEEECRDTIQVRDVAQLDKLVASITPNDQSCSAEHLADALNAFKAERLAIAHPVDKNKTIRQCETELVEYVQLDIESRSGSGEFRDEDEKLEVQQQLLDQAQMLIAVAKQLVPKERQNRPFNYVRR